jgi:hypothetical protein
MFLLGVVIIERNHKYRNLSHCHQGKGNYVVYWMQQKRSNSHIRSCWVWESKWNFLLLCECIISVQVVLTKNVSASSEIKHVDVDMWKTDFSKLSLSDLSDGWHLLMIHIPARIVWPNERPFSNRVDSYIRFTGWVLKCESEWCHSRIQVVDLRVICHRIVKECLSIYIRKSWVLVFGYQEGPILDVLSNTRSPNAKPLALSKLM